MDHHCRGGSGNPSGDYYCYSGYQKTRRKKAEEAELIAAESMEDSYAALQEEKEIEERLNREMEAMKNDKGMELKKNIRDFAEQNPEISAQLLKSWLNGGENNGKQ